LLGEQGWLATVLLRALFSGDRHGGGPGSLSAQQLSQLAMVILKLLVYLWAAVKLRRWGYFWKI
jgi:hypothetical protein